MSDWGATGSGRTDNGLTPAGDAINAVNVIYYLCELCELCGNAYYIRVSTEFKCAVPPARFRSIHVLIADRVQSSPQAGMDLEM